MSFTTQPSNNEARRIGMTNDERIAIVNECVNGITYSTERLFTKSIKDSIKPVNAVDLIKSAFLKVLN